MNMVEICDDLVKDGRDKAARECEALLAFDEVARVPLHGLEGKIYFFVVR